MIHEYIEFLFVSPSHYNTFIETFQSLKKFILCNVIKGDVLSPTPTFV